MKQYFLFSKKERTAVIILLLIAGSFVALPYFISTPREMPTVDPELLAFANDAKKTDSGSAKESVDKYRFSDKKEDKPVVLFRFNPNTIPEEGWIKLGVRPKTAATIIRYRSKGGRFRKPEDIRKIWGLSKDLADRLIAFVEIEKAGDPDKKETIATGASNNGIVTHAVSFIDINTAGVQEWKMLPGIGEVLANRIVHYRERATGFTNISAIKKVYGISDSVYNIIRPYLKTDLETLPKLNINTVTKENLSERTGVPIETARGIISYRQQYGKFKSVDDLKKIVFVNDSLLAIIRPHIIVE